MHPWIHLNDLETTAKKISSVFFDEYFVKFGTVSNNIGILSSNHACFDKKNLHDELKRKKNHCIRVETSHQFDFSNHG